MDNFVPVNRKIPESIKKLFKRAVFHIKNGHSTQTYCSLDCKNKRRMKEVITLLAIWSFSMNVAISHTHQTLTVLSDSGEVSVPAGRDPMTEKAAQMHAALAGRWENTMYPFDENASSLVEDAFLSYHFRTDGSYVKTLGGAKKSIEEHGRWEVTPDGTQILLFSTDQIAPEVIRIKYIQADELVLEHALKCNVQNFCTQLKSFYFNKGA